MAERKRFVGAHYGSQEYRVIDTLRNHALPGNWGTLDLARQHATELNAEIDPEPRPNLTAIDIKYFT